MVQRPTVLIKHEAGGAGGAATFIENKFISLTTQTTDDMSGTSNVKLINHYNSLKGHAFFADLFDNNDLITIYIQNDGEANQEVMTGDLSELKFYLRTAGSVVDFKLSDRTRRLLSEKGLVNITASVNSIIINSIVPLIQGPTVTTTNVALTKRDGSAFPAKDFASIWSTPYEMIKRLSSPAYTEDGWYLFWVDESNDLHFVPQVGDADGVDAVIKETDDTTLGINATWALLESPNTLLIYAGEDALGGRIWTKYVNQLKVNEAGGRMIYDLLNAGQSYAEAVKEGAGDLVARAKEIAQDYGQEFSQGLSGHQWKLTVTLRGTTARSVNEKVDIEAPSMGTASIGNWSSTNRKAMRISSIRHSVDKSGWKTILELVELEREAGTI